MSRRVLAAIFAALAVLAIIIAVSAIWNGLWSWLPWSAESRLERTTARAITAEDQALASGLEADGQGEQVQRIDTYAHQLITIQTATDDSATQARSAPDADTQLDPDRLDRLRHHDGELCRVSPALAGCTATPEPASIGG